MALARRLQRTAHELPIVLMSGQPAAVDLPGVDVLPKPVVPARLFAAVSDALAAHHITDGASST